MLAMVTAMMVVAIASEETTGVQNEHEEEHESEPAMAVLFPWFTEALGLTVFFILTRYLTVIPYTAVMFLLGTTIGIAELRLDNFNQLTQSVSQWAFVNSEVLLLVFLPGLIFRDAFTIGTYTCSKSVCRSV